MQPRRRISLGHDRPVLGWHLAPEDRAEAAPEFDLVERVSRRVAFDRAAATLGDDGWTLRGSDAALQALIDQEQTVQEGPHTDALANNQSVQLSGMLAAADRWPLLAATGAWRAAPFHTLVVLPLGPEWPGASIGVLSFARDERDPFTEADLAELTPVAQRTLLGVIGRWREARDLDRLVGVVRDDRHLAAGVSAALLGVSVPEAMVVLRARAFATGRTLRYVASEVVTEVGSEPGRHGRKAD